MGKGTALSDAMTEGAASRTDWRVAIHDALLASGVVRRCQIIDGLVSRAELQADPLWECDWMTDTWHKRTLEFMVARAETEAELPSLLEAARIALGVALLALEPELPSQADGHHGPVGPTGTLYEEVCSAGPWENVTYVSSREAIEAWRAKISTYASAQTKEATLWWSVRPEINARVPFSQTGASWYVYSRLVIGLPVMERIRRGEVRVCRKTVEDGVVSAVELQANGWTEDDFFGWTPPPELAEVHRKAFFG